MWRGLWGTGQLFLPWRCITNSGCSSISARNTHLSSVRMSMCVIPWDCILGSLLWLQPALPCNCYCHLHLCLCLTPHCQGCLFFGFFGASTVTSLKYLALFAVGGMGHSCSHVGWQSTGLFVDNPLCACLWITLCVPGLGTLWRALMDWASCASAHQLGLGQIPPKRVFFKFENVYEKPLLSSWCSEYS